MAEVISGEKISRHNVDKYSFKVLSIGSKQSNFKTFGKTIPSESTQTDKAPPNQSQEPSAQQNTPKQKKSDDAKDSLIESLMKKTDEMSSNFIKLQMKLEAMQEEHKAELEQVKQGALEEGKAIGREEAQKECEAKYEQTLNLFATSIAKLETNALEYNNALEKLKNELTSAALDIAKEVIDAEISQNSQNVAESLARELIEELKSASQITLRVNPKDFTHISQAFEEFKYIKVVADAAVSEGGVIAISDLENIDAQIEKRFERVKKVVLSE